MRVLAALALIVALPAAQAATPVAAQEGRAVVETSFAEPVSRYDHHILGDTPDWGALTFRVNTCPQCDVQIKARVTLRLPPNRVFEDIAPRLADLDGNGSAEAVVVETDLRGGARLAVYSADGLLAATAFIGRPHRWLAPFAIADLDGDGGLEVAYVDRPHLARMLRVVRLQKGRLVEVAALEGFSAHRIGDDFITGGARDCGAGPELVLPSGDWSRLMAVRLDGTALLPRDLGAFSFEAQTAALSCR